MNTVLAPVTAAALQFRPMQVDDLDAIEAIEQVAYPFPWTRGNFNDCLTSGYSCWVAHEEAEAGALVGYSILMSGAGEGHVLNCCVRPDCQGRGYGRRLMHNLLERAREFHLEVIFLEVRPSNVAALALYERLGFETLALRRDYYPAAQGREDALVMRLML